jgi:hypothetical protein
LGRLLEDWFEAQYRLSYNLDFLQFLNIKIYGDAFDACNPEERHLARRYEDYTQAVRDGRKLLPYPYYMRVSWYGAAIEAITKDLQHWKKWQDWWKFWDGNCYVFRDLKKRLSSKGWSMTSFAEVVQGNSFDEFMKDYNIPVYEGEINKWNQPH